MHKRTAFTLIEVLIVLAVVAIIAAILFPILASARERARMTTCASNLRQLQQACVLYAADNDNMLPPYNSRLVAIATGSDNSGVACDAPNPALISSLKSYTHSDAVWRCPSDSREFQAFPNGFSSCGAMALPLFTSYDYKGAIFTSHGIVPVRIDRTVGGLGPSTFTLLEDEARCPNDGTSSGMDYNAYNHRGEWNRVYLDGHVKSFEWDCTDPHRPSEK